LGVFALAVIAFSVYHSEKTKASLSKKGFEISTDNHDKVSVTTLSESEVEVKNRKDQTVVIGNVKKHSKVKVH
jgi:hypothetical protein